MTNRIAALLLLTTLPLLAGCVGVNAPVVPPAGMLYTHYRAPLTLQSHDTQLGPRKGTATVQHFWGWPFLPTALVHITWGDESLKAAAKDGGITNVKAADYEFTQVLGVYAGMTVHAYGD